jgi:sec-independent protein translocase protein TatC
MTQEDIDKSAAPLLDHLIELRRRLLWSVLAILVFFVVCFYFAADIFNLLVVPYERAAGGDASLKLIFTAPQEYFFVQVKIAFFGALFLAFPVIASQIYMFVAPGLYKNERSAFLPFLAATPVLFLMGAALVYFAVMPLAMSFFLSLQQAPAEGKATIELLPRVSEYLGLIMTLIFAFGLMFQLPVVVTLLAKAGILSTDTLTRNRRYAIVIAFIAAAILTPPDPISQIALAIPTMLLYEISILSARLVEKRRLERESQRESGEAAAS